MQQETQSLATTQQQMHALEVGIAANKAECMVHQAEVEWARQFSTFCEVERSSKQVAAFINKRIKVVLKGAPCPHRSHTVKELHELRKSMC